MSAQKSFAGDPGFMRDGGSAFAGDPGLMRDTGHAFAGDPGFADGGSASIGQALREKDVPGG